MAAGADPSFPWTSLMLSTALDPCSVSATRGRLDSLVLRSLCSSCAPGHSPGRHRAPHASLRGRDRRLRGPSYDFVSFRELRPLFALSCSRPAPCSRAPAPARPSVGLGCRSSSAKLRARAQSPHRPSPPSPPSLRRLRRWRRPACSADAPVSTGRWCSIHEVDGGAGRVGPASKPPSAVPRRSPWLVPPAPRVPSLWFGLIRMLSDRDAENRPSELGPSIGMPPGRSPRTATVPTPEPAGRTPSGLRSG